GSRPAFEEWLARGPRQRTAYSRASEIFALGKTLGRGDHEAPGGRPSIKPRWLVGSAALAAAGALCWFALAPGGRLAEQGPAPPAPGAPAAVLETLTAAREVRLADGSLIRLAAATRISVAFDRSVRRLALDSGEARFAVAHERRPFIVLAAGGTVTAHGTIIGVAVRADRHV